MFSTAASHNSDVQQEAIRYITQGYFPIRLRNKQPSGCDSEAWRECQHTVADVPAVFDSLSSPVNIGIRIGVPHPAFPTFRLTCLDLDTAPDDCSTPPRVLRCFLPNSLPVRTGKYHRINIWCFTNMLTTDRHEFRAAEDHPHRVSATSSKGRDAYAKLDIRHTTSQSMVPPSVHPDSSPDGSRWPVRWQGIPLHHYHFHDLPHISRSRISEIIAVFLEPKAAIHDLDTLAPENIHNPLTRATGWMANNGWSGQDVADRMEVAWHYLEDDFGSLLQERRRTYESFTKEWQTAWAGAQVKFASASHPTVSARSLDSQSSEPIDKSKATKSFRRLMANDWIIKHTFEGAAPRLDQAGILRIYRDGWWQEIKDSKVKGYLLKEWEVTSSKDAREAYNTIMETCGGFPLPLSGRPDLVCTPNGVLCPSTLTPAPHSPDYHFTSITAYSYEPNSSCPVYDQFLADTFRQTHFGDSDDRNEEQLQHDSRAMAETWEEFAGYCMTPYIKFQKFVNLLGPTGSGKSTLVETLRWVIPIGLTDILASKMKDRAYHFDLALSRVNVSDETGSESLNDYDFLNSLVAGQPQRVRALYQQSQLVNPTTKLIFLGNRQIRIPDTAGAWQRRMITLVAPNKRAATGVVDVDLVFKLKQEAEAIFSRYCEGLHRLLARNAFQHIHYTNIANHDSRVSSDSVALWFTDRLVYDPDNRLPSELLYKDYQFWCKENGFTPTNINNWGHRLTNFDDRLKARLLRYKSSDVAGPSRPQQCRPVKLQEGLQLNTGVNVGY